MNDQIAEHFLYAAVKTVGMDVAPPVKVDTCRALSQLLSDSIFGHIQHHALDLFSSLIELPKNASDETMHLVLETMQAAVTSGHEVAASIVPVIFPIMLSMWASHVSDPFISIDALEVLEGIKKASGCIHPLASQVLPHIGPILSNGNPLMTKNDQGYFDSGCCRHMTGNKEYLKEFKEIDGGYVAFGGGANGARITGKGTIHTELWKIFCAGECRQLGPVDLALLLATVRKEIADETNRETGRSKAISTLELQGLG